MPKAIYGILRGVKKTEVVNAALFSDEQRVEFSGKIRTQRVLQVPIAICHSRRDFALCPKTLEIFKNPKDSSKTPRITKTSSAILGNSSNMSAMAVAMSIYRFYRTLCVLVKV